MRLLAFVCGLVAFRGICPGQEIGPRMIRSLSGPSGKTIGPKFVLDEVRSRFIYPQDKNLVVYFEWLAPLGDHVLSAMWKGPDGRIQSLSPDIKVQTQTKELNAYWIFGLTPGMASGLWVAEVRLDGQPA